MTSHAPKQQISAPRLPAFETPLPLNIPEQELKRNLIEPSSEGYPNHAPRTSKRHVFLLIILALLLTAAIGTGLVWIVLSHSDHPASLHSVTSPVASSPAQSTVTSPASPAPSTLTPGTSEYPPLAASYAGKVVDIMTNEDTGMFLTHIQQSQGSISGFFQGLGLVGPFKGTVNTAGHLHFTVKVQASNTTLSFDGDIKIGGDMVGSFDVLDQYGHRTGEAGAWNVASSP